MQSALPNFSRDPGYNSIESPRRPSLPGRRPRRFSPSCAGPTQPITIPGAPLSLRAPPTTILAILRRTSAAYNGSRRLSTSPGAAYDDPRRSSLYPGAAHGDFRRPTPGRRRLQRLPAPLSPSGRRLRRFPASSAGPTPLTTSSGAFFSHRAPPTYGLAYGDFRYPPPSRRRLLGFPAPLFPWAPRYGVFCRPPPGRRCLGRSLAPLSISGRRLRRLSPSDAGLTPLTTVPGAYLSLGTPPTAISGDFRRPPPGRRRLRRLPAPLLLGRRLRRFSASSAGPNPLTTISGAPFSPRAPPTAFFRRLPPGRRRLRRFPAPLLPLSGAEYDLQRRPPAHDNRYHLSLSLSALSSLLTVPSSVRRHTLRVFNVVRLSRRPHIRSHPPLTTPSRATSSTAHATLSRDVIRRLRRCRHHLGPPSLTTFIARRDIPDLFAVRHPRPAPMD